MPKNRRLEIVVLDLSAAQRGGATALACLQPTLWLPRTATDRDEALVHLRSGGGDAVVLVADPGDEAAAFFVHEVWQLTCKPVVVALSHADPTYGMSLVDLGAEDFLCSALEPGEPSAARELVHRLRRSLRAHHTGSSERARIVLDQVVVDPSRESVRLAGQPLALSRTEYRLLLALGSQAGELVDHQRLLRSVWSSAQEGRVEYLRTYVNRLREKLGWRDDDGSGPRIVAVRGRGYRLELPRPSDRTRF